MFSEEKYLLESLDPTNDVFNFSNFSGDEDVQKIIISCKNKNRTVTAILTDDIGLDIQAQWENFLGNLSASFGGLTDFFTGSANVQGRTLQQPWMSRMNYKSTKPLQFTVPLRFIAGANDGVGSNVGFRSGAKEEVWEPILALASFCYPRILNGNDGQGTSYLLNEGDLHPAVEENGWTEYESWVRDTIVGLSSGLMSFAIPGQNPFSEADSSNKYTGDPVSVRLGRFGEFKSVYITHLQGKVSSILDDEGYPVSAEINVTFQVQDSCVVNSDGTFSFQGSDVSQAFLSRMSDTLGKIASLTDWATRKVNTSWVQSAINVVGSNSGTSLINSVRALFGL